MTAAGTDTFTATVATTVTATATADTAAPLRADEAAALSALLALDVLDSAPEPEFDALVRAAALACDTPIGLLGLVDGQRLWFKARHGLQDFPQTPRGQAFCTHTVLGDELLEVPDARLDPRFAANPLVLGLPDVPDVPDVPGLRFYAGVPLRLSDGSRVGSLCVLDRQPRRLDPRQRELLQLLGVAATRALERRRDARIQAAHALGESRFHALSENAPVGVFANDPTGACTYVNPRWMQVYGLSAEEAMGDGWMRALHPQDRAAVLAVRRAAAARHEEFELEFRILRPDRATRRVHSRARPVLNAEGVLQGYVGSVEDITDRSTLEEVLDRTGRLANVGGWEMDLRTEQLTWSAQTRRIHDVDEHYQPTPTSAMTFYDESVRLVLSEAVQRGLALGVPWDLEVPLRTALGRDIWVRALGSVSLEDGEPARLVGAVQDITEQRRRWQELQQEQTLRSQLQAQVIDINRLLHERSEMLDVMAHEVRQPLNNASAALQSAALALRSPDRTVATPRLERAQAVLAQVLGSIDNTLAVAALLARPDPIEREYADLAALVEVAVADVPQPQRARIRVQRDTDARSASMDASLMRLALRNLLTNALRYSPPDSPVELRLSESEDPLAVLIDIINGGVGIPAERVQRLFERGAHRGRAEQVASKGSCGQGMGLGLYIVRRVMELHGGSASLLHNGGQGVTMRLVLTHPLGD